MSDLQPSALQPSVARPLPAELTPAIGPAIDALAQAAEWPLYVKSLADGRLLHANTALATALARPVESLIGLPEVQLFDGELPSSWNANEQAALARGQAASASEAKVSYHGAVHELRVLRWPCGVQAGGRPTHLLCLWHDQTRERAREAQLKQVLVQLEQQHRTNDQLRQESGDAALRDRATGLYKQAHFEDQLRREVDLSTREHREFALVLIALDPPTEAVRAHGETGARRVHEALGRLLRGNTRAMDASSRIADDRFAVLLSGVGLATAHSRMEGLRRQCATQIVALDGQELSFSVSMGVASFPHTSATQEALLQACEGALKQAQGRGGNHVTLASIRLGAE